MMSEKCIPILWFIFDAFSNLVLVPTRYNTVVVLLQTLLKWHIRHQRDLDVKDILIFSLFQQQDK